MLKHTHVCKLIQLKQLTSVRLAYITYLIRVLNSCYFSKISDRFHIFLGKSFPWPISFYHVRDPKQLSISSKKQFVVRDTPLCQNHRKIPQQTSNGVKLSLEIIWISLTYYLTQIKSHKIPESINITDSGANLSPGHKRLQSITQVIALLQTAFRKRIHNQRNKIPFWSWHENSWTERAASRPGLPFDDACLRTGVDVQLRWRSSAIFPDSWHLVWSPLARNDTVQEVAASKYRNQPSIWSECWGLENDVTLIRIWQQASS